MTSDDDTDYWRQVALHNASAGFRTPAPPNVIPIRYPVSVDPTEDFIEAAVAAALVYRSLPEAVLPSPLAITLERLAQAVDAAEQHAEEYDGE